MSKLKDQAIKELNEIREKKGARVWVYVNCLAYLSLSVGVTVLVILMARI